MLMLVLFPLDDTRYGGYTALHLAVQESHVDTVRILLDAKARPDSAAYLPVRYRSDRAEFELISRDEENSNSSSSSSSCLLAISPLSIACCNIVARQSAVQRQKAADVLELLLATNVKVHICSVPSQLTDLNQVAAIAAATMAASTNVHGVDDPGASVESVSSVTSQGVLSIDSQGMDSDSEWSLQGLNGEAGYGQTYNKGTGIPSVGVTLFNHSPLFYAVKNYRVPVVKMLLKAGADADETIETLRTPAMFGDWSSGKSQKHKSTLLRLPLTHFSVANFHPNVASKHVILDEGFTSLSQQVLATLDVLLGHSYYGGGSTIDESQRRSAAAHRLVRTVLFCWLGFCMTFVVLILLFWFRCARVCTCIVLYCIVVE